MSRIAVWAPSFFAQAGGIQRLSCDVALACKEFAEVDQLGLVEGKGPPTFGDKAWFAFRVLHHCLRRRPRLVISMHLGFLPLAGLLKRIFRFRHVLWLHGVEAWSSGPRFVRSVDLFLASSDLTSERSSCWRPQAVPCRTVYPTIDFSRFFPGPKSEALLDRYGVNIQDAVLLTVGRLVAGNLRKGHDMVIRALPEVVRQRPNVRYLVVGEGPDRARLGALAKEAGVERHVIFAGAVSEEELVEHYRLAEVFVMPSQREGFGIAFLEALGCGCKVIAGDGDAAKEALIGGELGELISSGQPGTLARVMLAALASEATPDNRERALRQFGWERFQQEIQSVCNN